MALDAKQIAELLKLRALGFNQEEIAQALETSQQVIAYQLKKLKLLLDHVAYLQENLKRFMNCLKLLLKSTKV